MVNLSTLKTTHEAKQKLSILTGSCQWTKNVFLSFLVVDIVNCPLFYSMSMCNWPWVSKEKLRHLLGFFHVRHDAKLRPSVVAASTPYATWKIHGSIFKAERNSSPTRSYEVVSFRVTTPLTKPFTIMGIKLQLWVSQLFKFSLPLTFIRNIFLLPSNNVVIYDSISPSVPFSLLCVKTRHFLKAKEKHKKWHRSSFRPLKNAKRILKEAPEKNWNLQKSRGLMEGFWEGFQRLLGFL